MNKIEKFQGTTRWLSNFEPCNVVFDGETYPSVEHAYQAAKTLIVAERKKIKNCNRAGKAKKLGMTVTLRNDWTEERRIKTMYDLNLQKFSQKDLKEKLLATGDSILEEGNTWGDQFWGICKGSGRNELGKILMKIRAELRNIA